ncbi:hypothetical protein LX81_01299 [Palleronia aestuarii]|uniref:DUF6314 domain-containing protein n=1 Tax=Palleronia aestuarii TaxID=568105 RepID=A0A2W7NLM7_9RHOB|nr:DUF6314 family protein [Palleronia aestuarii]PZX17574.1 hypothetical protein LX81_01299 [Palleronia aestuarii]
MPTREAVLPDLFDFTGEWRLDRRILDARGGREGQFHGRATFAPVEGGLDYSEAGLLRFSAEAAFEARQAYRWEEAGARIAVRFSDGRAFHTFDPDLSAPEAHHDCPPDRYHVRYDLSDWPRWTAEWRVSGPRKEYTLIGRYDRD